MSINEAMATIPNYSLLPRAVLRAAIEQHVAEAVAREREECAKVADDMDYSPNGDIARLIRARADNKETT